MITLNSESNNNMKKYFLVALTALALVSCEEEIVVNTPAFEAMNGYNFWKASSMQATVDNGDLVIVGAHESENITLYIDNYAFGEEYTLGVSNVNVATFSKKIDDVVYNYSTSSSTGKGFIKLDPVEKQIPGAISGIFYAEMVPVTGSAVLPGQEVVNFNKGTFFQIPLKEAVAPAPEENPAP